MWGAGRGGELIGKKDPTNNQSWKILKSVCDLAASAEAFCSKNVKLEDPVADQPLHSPASNFSAFTVAISDRKQRRCSRFRDVPKNPDLQVRGLNRGEKV